MCTVTLNRECDRLEEQEFKNKFKISLNCAKADLHDSIVKYTIVKLVYVIKCMRV